MIIGRVLAIVVVLIALLLGTMACILPEHWLGDVLLFTRFFEVMLPVLGVGALLKYILNRN